MPVFLKDFSIFFIENVQALILNNKQDDAVYGNMTRRFLDLTKFIIHKSIYDTSTLILNNN